MSAEGKPEHGREPHNAVIMEVTPFRRAKASYHLRSSLLINDSADDSDAAETTNP
jgi:hypothetical protein